MALGKPQLVVLGIWYILIGQLVVADLSPADHKLNRPGHRLSDLDAAALKQHFHYDERAATAIQQPKQSGYFYEEEAKRANSRVHHSAQKFQQHKHEQRQQQMREQEQQPQQEQDASPSKVSLLTIAIMTTIMAAMSGLGALPYFFVGTLARTWSGLANAVACGVMLAASFGLVKEGGEHSGLLTVSGIIAGALFISASKSWLDQHEDVSFEDFKGADARKVVLIIGVMAAHAVGEGSGVGVSFSGRRGWAQGTLVTLAIGLHNVPEGLAVATVMSARGAPPQRAFMWTVLSALPQALVAVPSYLFVEAFTALLPLALGFAAGSMLWIVFAELMPEALEQAPHPQVATAATLSFSWLAGMSMMFEALEQPDGSLRNPIQADMRALLPFLLACVPAVAAAVAAALGTVSAIHSRSAALAMAAAVQASLGAVTVLQQLAQRRLALPAALGWLLLGAAAAIAAWRLFFAAGFGGAPKSPKSPRRLPSKSAPDLELAAVQSGELPQLQSKRSWGLQEGKHQQLLLQQQQNGYSPRAGSTPRSVDSNGFVQVSLAAGAANSSAAGFAEWHVNPGQLLKVVSVGSEASSHSSSQRVLPFGLLVLLCYLVPYGMSVAAAVKSNLDQSVSLAVPLALLALPLGAGFSGLVVAGSRLSKQLVAAVSGAAYSIAPLTAAAVLASLPVGFWPSEEIHYAGAGAEVLVMCAGALVASGLLVCWPVAVQGSRLSAQVGACVGGASTVFICGLLAALCVGTPYCLAGVRS